MPSRSRGLQLGLVVIADATFGHQSRGLVREAVAALAGAGLGVLVGVLSGVGHDDLRGWHDDGERSRRGRHDTDRRQR